MSHTIVTPFANKKKLIILNYLPDPDIIRPSWVCSSAAQCKVIQKLFDHSSVLAHILGIYRPCQNYFSQECVLLLVVVQFVCLCGAGTFKIRSYPNRLLIQQLRSKSTPRTIPNRFTGVRSTLSLTEDLSKNSNRERKERATDSANAVATANPPGQFFGGPD